MLFHSFSFDIKCLLRENSQSKVLQKCLSVAQFFYSISEMAEGNGEIIEEMATTNKTDGNGEPERTPDYPKLVEYGLDKRVCKLY